MDVWASPAVKEGLWLVWRDKDEGMCELYQLLMMELGMYELFS